MPVKLNSSGGGSSTIDIGSTGSTYAVTLPNASGTIALLSDIPSSGLNPSAYVVNGLMGNQGTIKTSGAGPDQYYSVPISASTYTVVPFILADDTNGWHTGNKFKPTIAGYYNISAYIWVIWIDALGTADNSWQYAGFFIRKNGTDYLTIDQLADDLNQNSVYNQTITNDSRDKTFQTSKIVYMNGTTDYIEFVFWCNPHTEIVTNYLIGGFPTDNQIQASGYSAFLITSGSSSGGGNYSLPTASSNTLGGIKVGSGLTVTNGVLSATGGGGGNYSLPTASISTLGGIKVGSGLTITDGTLSTSLPTASSNTLGGVKVGAGLTITDGTLSVTSSTIYTGTYVYNQNFPIGSYICASFTEDIEYLSLNAQTTAITIGANGYYVGVGYGSTYNVNGTWAYRGLNLFQRVA